MSPPSPNAASEGPPAPLRRGALPAALAVALLLPFAGRAFGVDEPLFLALARHVQDAPLDFFGFDVHWYETPQPMHRVTRNPPLAGHLLALAAGLVGWSEVALRSAALLPAAAAAWGAFALARDLTRRPMLAAVLTVATPAFLVPASSVTCDVLLLALWTWSVALWRRGLVAGSTARLVAGAALAGLAVWTKYFGLALVPLLAVTTYGRRRRAEELWLLVPLGLALAYHLATRELYGRSLLWEARTYAAQLAGAGASGPGTRAFLAVAYAGACFPAAVAFAPLACARRTLAGGAAAATVALGAALATGTLPGFAPELVARSPVLFPVQAVLAAASGAVLCALALGALRRARDPDERLLAAWVLGTLLFAGFLNWSNNARSILPVVPAAAILLARRLDRLPRPPGRAAVAAALAPAAALAVLVLAADARWANGVRDAAAALLERHHRADAPLSFEGHWGLQHYLERGGARPLDLAAPDLAPGARVVLPENNTNVHPPPPSARVVDVLETTQALPLHTQREAVGAGFYASALGPLPWVFAAAPPERYVVVEVVDPEAWRLGGAGPR